MTKTEMMTDTRTGEQIPVRARDGKEVDEYDMMKALKADRKKKRQDVAPRFLGILRDNGYEPVCLDTVSQHYRILGSIDYWPTTGTWKAVGQSWRGRGIYSLLEALKGVRNA
jgi:hypothetical protein